MNEIGWKVSRKLEPISRLVKYRGNIIGFPASRLLHRLIILSMVFIASGKKITAGLCQNIYWLINKQHLAMKKKTYFVYALKDNKSKKKKYSKKILIKR